MRQPLLNGVLVGALAGLFCLLAATAYTEAKHDDAEASCVSENRGVKPRAARCQTCVAAPCGAMAVKNCTAETTCTVNGKLVERDPKSSRGESRLWAGMQMQP
ncbi:hypothetical protein [Mesorhizobium sp.]|uniref:hypothetical protein n=1 Tax=Mesorhizobium sp. TaxID=1871066 RepID=UPI003BAC930B